MDVLKLLARVQRSVEALRALNAERDETFDAAEPLEILEDAEESEECATLEVVEDSKRTEAPRKRKKRKFKLRMDSFIVLEDRCFLELYRMTKQNVTDFVRLVEGNLPMRSEKNHAMTPTEQLLCALRFLATGSLQFGTLHKSTTSRAVKQMMDAIVPLKPTYVRMPGTPEKMARRAEGFRNVAGLPDCVGAVGVTRVSIQSPGGPQARHYKYRGESSFKVQIVADARMLIANIARQPGSVKDHTLYEGSGVKADFHKGKYLHYHLLAGVGYASTPHLHTPYVQTASAGAFEYNRKHSATLFVAEKTIEMWKCRFPGLDKTLRIRLETARAAILASAILYNFCIINNVPMPPTISSDVTTIE